MSRLAVSPVFSLSSSPLAVQLSVLSFGGCSACSGRFRRHSHGRAAARVVLPKPLHVCVSYLYDCHSLSSSESRAEGRYEKVMDSSHVRGNWRLLGGSLSGCFARCWPQRNAFLHTLAVLARSDICRLGVMALLRDIVNGALPDEARQLLLASRLVALTKPSGDGYRPIAVGELFYRLAAIVAVRRVSSEAARLLSPHQFGIGVPAGGEKIVHSLQHELTDTSKRLAMLQVDIANAFNSCDRARLLCELYALPGLQSV